MIYLTIFLIMLAAVGIFFLFRWLFLPYRRALRQARRACRRGDVVACKRLEELKKKGRL